MRQLDNQNPAIHGGSINELHEYLDEAKVDAEIVEGVIGELVNDERSRFYLHG